MIARVPFPRFFSLPKVIDLFTPLLFLYFVTLHADKLHLQFGGTIRINNLLALGLLIILMSRLRSELFRLDKWVAIGLGAITASIMLSLVFSPHFKRCLMQTCWFFWTLLCYFWLPYQLVAKLDREKIQRLFLLSFMVVGVYALSQTLTGMLGDPFVSQWIIPRVGRPNALCYEPSYYALYMTPFVCYQTFLYLGRDPSVSGKKLGFIFLVYLASASTGAFLSFLTFFFFAFFYHKVRKRWAVLILKLMIAMLPLFIFAGPLALNFFLKNFDVHGNYSVKTRFHGITDCIILFKSRPIVGYGLGGIAPERIKFPAVYEQCEALDPGSQQKAGEPTNIGTEILASLGLVGALAFALFFLLFLKEYFESKRSLQKDAFFVAIIVMLIAWQFNQTLMRPYCWTFFAIAAAFLKTNPQSGQSLVQAEPVQMLDKAS